MKKKVRCSCCSSVVNAEITERGHRIYDIIEEEEVMKSYFFFRCPVCNEKTEYLDPSEVEVEEAS